MTGVDAWFPRTDPHLLRHTGDSGDSAKRLPSSNSGDSTYLKPRRASISGPGALIAPLQVVSRRLPTRAKWLLAFYCCLCVCFLSGQLLSKLFLDPRSTAVSLRIAKATQDVSPLQSLPIDHLLSKITSIYPHPLALKPYVLRADTDASSVTACLWTEAEHLDSLPVWASRWKGPISALVTTTAPPGSAESQELAKKLEAVGRIPSTRHKLSAHILHLESRTTQNPNSFLNLARIFAQTPRVALFPGNLSVVPPKTFQRSIASSSSFSANKPVVFAMRGRSSFPFSPLSPILMHRDDPVWCTERFFTGLSRSADWAECVWQVWLESFGSMDARATTDWVNEFRPSYNAASIEVSRIPGSRIPFTKHLCRRRSIVG
ncbi:hypothetical protein PsYK624_120950 [Phanerochaete sordida]|uniref:Uncharacterized protein n=1 Tax=Phanerochaete sordida TaxID=48140 RepID=A0A9P3LIP9_9APHY|nr:hypothetical protein PsYK624_120950 [Phanerochaete sordida]